VVELTLHGVEGRRLRPRAFLIAFATGPPPFLPFNRIHLPSWRSSMSCLASISYLLLLSFSSFSAPLAPPISLLYLASAEEVHAHRRIVWYRLLLRSFVVRILLRLGRRRRTSNRRRAAAQESGSSVIGPKLPEVPFLTVAACLRNGSGQPSVADGSHRNRVPFVRPAFAITSNVTVPRLPRRTSGFRRWNVEACSLTLENPAAGAA